MAAPLKVQLDPTTLDRLYARAVAERRSASDQAAVILMRALAREDRRRQASVTATDPK
jgi:hypothetical protein